jgi:hypothetical protein
MVLTIPDERDEWQAARLCSPHATHRERFQPFEAEREREREEKVGGSSNGHHI